MIEPTQDNMPEESNIDHGRRSLLKALVGGASGLVFTTAVTSSAFAKRRRRQQGQGKGKGQPNPQPQGKSKRRHLRP